MPITTQSHEARSFLDVGSIRDRIAVSRPIRQASAAALAGCLAGPVALAAPRARTRGR